MTLGEASARRGGTTSVYTSGVISEKFNWKLIPMTERPDLDFGYNFGYAVRENPHLPEDYKKKLKELEKRKDEQKTAD